MKRPCIGVDCGVLIDSGSRCADCKLPSTPKPRQRGRRGRSTSDWTWRKLSAKIRRLSPFCEWCGSTEDLTVDHIIAIDDRPDLAHDELNLRVLCRSHNSQRSDRCTDEERAQVLDAIEQRRQRLLRCN